MEATLGDVTRRLNWKEERCGILEEDLKSTKQNNHEITKSIQILQHDSNVHTQQIETLEAEKAKLLSEIEKSKEENTKLQSDLQLETSRSFEVTIPLKEALCGNEAKIDENAQITQDIAHLQTKLNELQEMYDARVAFLADADEMPKRKTSNALTNT
eukprot:Platyproteum_vivax@DN16650_c0_g1_i1.p1